MTEQSTDGVIINDSPFELIQNDMAEIKRKYLVSVLLMMATGNWDPRPKQLEGLAGTNCTHLIPHRRREINTLFAELGSSNLCRSYRMQPYVFEMLGIVLRDKLEPHYDDLLMINQIRNGRIDHTL
jgi:hypothetical protein